MIRHPDSDSASGELCPSSSRPYPHCSLQLSKNIAEKTVRPTEKTSCVKKGRPLGSAVARVSEAPPEISRGAPHTLLSYYYELQ